MVAHLRAELLREIAHFRAAQHYIERTGNSAAISGEQMVDHCLLLGRHLFVCEWFEAVAAQIEFLRRRRGLGVGHTCKDY